MLLHYVEYRIVDSKTMHRPLQELKFQPPAESNLLAPSANTLLYIRIVFLFYIISDGY